MNNIEIITNGSEVRRLFIEKFTLKWEKFQVINKEWIEYCAKRNDILKYDELYLWERMRYQSISFTDALNLLRKINGEVLFMSENKEKPNCKGITFNATEYKGAVAKMDAHALADLIEYEWNTGWELSAQCMFLEETVLPEDLYVFDEKMEHLLVFTHETDHWELEWDDPMGCAASRFCMSYGFSVPKRISYGEINELLKKRLDKDDSFELTISYSGSSCFWEFTIFKKALDNKTNQYWFGFSPKIIYMTLEQLMQSHAFNGKTLKEISQLVGVSFKIVSINGVEYDKWQNS